MARAVAACADATALAPGASRNCGKTVTVPADAKLTAAHFQSDPNFVPARQVVARYVFDADVPFGLPFRPTPFTATFAMSVNNTPFTITLPIQARSERDIFAARSAKRFTSCPRSR